MSYTTTRRCMSCLLIGTHSRSCPDLYIYDLWAPPVVPGPQAYQVEDTQVITTDAWTGGVMDAFSEPPQSHAKRRTPVGPMPVWPVVLILAGLTLIAFGLVLNEPMAVLIHGMLSG